MSDSVVVISLINFYSCSSKNNILNIGIENKSYESSSSKKLFPLIMVQAKNLLNKF